MIIVSTLHGMNMFYKLWVDAQNKQNDYIYLSKYIGQRCNSRDEKWKEETIRNTSAEQFQQEFECDFLGSVDTLIAPTKIKNMQLTPIESKGGLDMYEKPGQNICMYC